MTEFDPEEKRRQAAQVYAGMTEGELRKLAEEASSLSDIGKEALKSEIKSRGLEIQLAESEVVGSDVEIENFVTIRQFRDIPDALLAKGALESAGIECHLGDENTIRMDWLWSNALGGVKLWVKKEDAETATQLLDQGVPDVFDVKGVGEYTQPRCPQCQSLDISYEDLNRPLAYSSVWVGIPFPVSRRRWKCESCGHIWQGPNESTPRAE
jgi:hypothetical protein